MNERIINNKTPALAGVLCFQEIGLKKDLKRTRFREFNSPDFE